MKNQIAYIDERGNFGFKFSEENVSSHFIITAILIDSDKVKQTESAIENVRKKYFQTGEMKSSSVAKNDNRRIKILTDLNSIDFHIFSLIIDKRKLSLEGGLGYKKSFFKFLNSILYRELFKTHLDITIIADEHGSQEFMKSFEKYIQLNHAPDLFSQTKLYFDNSKSNMMIQLADFIAGTIAKGFEDHDRSKVFDSFLGIMKLKIIELKEWPPPQNEYILDVDSQVDNEELNRLIKSHCINLAIRYINDNSNSKDYDVNYQILFLKYLLLNVEHIDPYRFISTTEIIKNINQLSDIPINQEQVRFRIVGKLRDRGIIIASSTSGYKIPVCESDIYLFINHSNSIISPMLTRVDKVRKHFMLATKNRFDILNKTEYNKLKKYFED